MKLFQGGHAGAEDKAPRTVSEVMNSRQTRQGDSQRSTPRAARTRAVLARWAQRRCQEAEHLIRQKPHKGGPPRERGRASSLSTPSQTTQQKVESRCSIVCFLFPATYTPTWQRGCSFFRGLPRASHVQVSRMSGQHPDRQSRLDGEQLPVGDALSTILRPVKALASGTVPKPDAVTLG